MTGPTLVAAGVGCTLAVLTLALGLRMWRRERDRKHTGRRADAPWFI
jgi:hypothetical protein